MKLHTVILLYFKDKDNGDSRQIEVRGILNSPDRPVKGEDIYWPWVAKKGESASDQDCALYVESSSFHTLETGKIAPRIVLKCGEGPEKPASMILERNIWNECHRAIKLFLIDPTVRWGHEYVFVPWPETPDELPKKLSEALEG